MSGYLFSFSIYFLSERVTLPARFSSFFLRRPLVLHELHDSQLSLTANRQITIFATFLASTVRGCDVINGDITQVVVPDCTLNDDLERDEGDK